MVMKTTKKKLEELRNVREVVTRYRNFESEFQRVSQLTTQDESSFESQQRDDAKRLQNLEEQTAEMKNRLRLERESNLQKRKTLENELRNLQRRVRSTRSFLILRSTSSRSRIKWLNNPLKTFNVADSCSVLIHQHNFQRWLQSKKKSPSWKRD